MNTTELMSLYPILYDGGFQWTVYRRETAPPNFIALRTFPSYEQCRDFRRTLNPARVVTSRAQGQGSADTGQRMHQTRKNHP